MRWKTLALGLVSTLALTPSLYANSITTTFNGRNGFTGNMFDVMVGSNGLTINALDVNVDTGSFSIDVYIKTGTYVGSETNASAWTLVSATPVLGLGEGNETAVAITPYSLSAGSSYGMYVTIDPSTGPGRIMYYGNGSSTFSNADLTLTTGNGEGGLFGSDAVYSNRIWNGVIDYSVTPAAVAATPEPTTILLTASGLSSLLYARRKRRNA